MKCSKKWLSEWVNPSITEEVLCHQLTMAGFEVEEVVPGLNDDAIIDISITPNRGDCLSIRGMAREIAAITRSPLSLLTVPSVPATHQDTLPVSLRAKSGCPRYVGRVIRNVSANGETPAWLKERLQSAGVNSISPIVDVTNYVMLELGQPMHAFDLNTIQEGIVVRLAKASEKIKLLDGSEKELDKETLVIADAKKALAIAGVMGGLDSCVTLLTNDIFLESAFFSPAVIARQRQHFALSSESAYRFERGVDPSIQREAIERATKLIVEIAGGVPGPVIEVESKPHLPKSKSINLNAKKITQLLGMSVPDNEVDTIFSSLRFECVRSKQKWNVKVPSYRFDMAIPEDLIEEVARLYGYDKLPTHDLAAKLHASASKESAPDLHALRQAWSDQGFNEIISYSFIDKSMQALLDPEMTPRELLNPITAEMSVMRTNLWPGLLTTLLYNVSRQQQRVRLFEVGTCFTSDTSGLRQIPRLAGLIMGNAFSEQWGFPAREVDFYDLKGHVENVVGQFHSTEMVNFKPDTHPALHPGQTAGIYVGEQKIGLIGALHPSIGQQLDLVNKVFMFEIDLNSLLKKRDFHLKDLSKFPEIRRDVAILVNQTIPSQSIQDTIKRCAGDWLKDVFIFDVYQGKGISPGRKSIALALIWQHPTRTLVDDEVTGLVNQVIEALKGHLGAELRS